MISASVVSAVAAALLAGLVPSSAAAQPAAAADRYDRPVVRVTCSAGNVRTAPRKSARKIGMVYRGERVRILKGFRPKERRYGFTHFKIRFQEGGKRKEGWIVFACADLYEQ